MIKLTPEYLHDLEAWLRKEHAEDRPHCSRCKREQDYMNIILINGICEDCRNKED